MLIVCYGCVPLSQQIADSEAAEIEGYVCPLVLDTDTFYNAIFDWVYDPMKVDDELRTSDNNNTYHGTFEGNPVYIRNCRCFSKVKIVSDKLVLIHRYGGGESNRESTKLLWTGRYYQNPKGEYVVDVVLYSDKKDFRKALLQEKKILDLEPLKLRDQKFVWINLIGYDTLLKYDY